jgi:NitT/TauT family transport system substrate-binding protein
MPIVLQETLRGLFYAPFYAALSLGAYEQEALDVRFTSAPTPADSARRLMTGEVDVTWGGPMRVLLTREREPGADLVCFGEAVTRDPFFLVGRRPNPGFALRDLLGVALASVSEVPTPWMCLQEDMRRAGLDPATVRRIADRGMAENAAALARGEIDVVQLFEPFVEELLESGAGHLWYAAASRGYTSYTCFYARRGVIERRRDELRRMVRALHRTLKWIDGASGAAIARAVEAYFPQVPAARLAAALARYKALGVWGKDTRLPRSGYERLAASLVSGGLIRAVPAYEEAVDNSFADEAVAADLPPLAAAVT